MEIKTDVISKAQAIIHKLTSKSDQDESMLNMLNNENKELKTDVSHKQRAITDLHS